MKRFIVMSAAVLALAACDNGEKPAASGAGSAAAAAEKPMTDQQLESAEIPVEADFEEEAATAITSDTLDDQVSALEKEINGDKAE